MSLKVNSPSLSISQKLLLLITVITATALLLSSVATIYSGRSLLLERLQKDMAVLAELTAMNSSAAIMFEESKGAEKMLANLRSESSIVTAALYKADGELLSHYIRKGDKAIPPHHLPEVGTVVSEQAIRIVQSVMVDGEKIGGIYIESDLSRLTALTQQLIYTLIGISVSVLLLAIGFSIRLQGLVTAPILKLTNLTRKVTSSSDFSQRAVKTAADEVGTLFDGFNHMMEEIESRDEVLQQNNRELAIARQDAIDASDAKSSFLANMSHEIRTPMNGVLGMLELLADTPLQDEQQEFARTARNSAFALLDVINDILDFSKIEAGRLEIENIDMELLPLCEDVSALLSEKAHDKGIELTCFVYSDVPSCIVCDPTRLRQVLLNLMGNAVKFTATGEVSLQVSLVEPVNNNQATLKFAVKDTGIGISRQQQQNLFEAFSQADASTTRQFGGTGLGLSISKQLTELMGGSIHIDSKPGTGSTFWFELPVQLAESTEKDQSLADISGKKVLIVDDNETNRLILEHYCSNWGVQYVSHIKGKDALTALNETDFDCAVIDYHMPEMDGLQLADNIRQHSLYSGFPILMLSSAGYTTKSQSVDICLMKPARQTLLFKSLAKLLLPQLHQQQVPQKTTLPLFKSHVLLVDDNNVNQKVAGNFLQKIGVTVDFAGNGKDALEAINQQDYDLVFMDCHMPVMDGYQATESIRQWEVRNNLPRLPVVAMTANVLLGDKEACFEAGMDDYLAKPIQQRNIVDIMAKWLASAQYDVVEVVSTEAENEATNYSSEIEGLIAKNAGKLQLDPALYRELLIDFYCQDQQTVGQIKGLLETEQYESAKEIIHRIKGTAGNLGFQAIFNLATEIEQNISDQVDKQQLLTLFSEFESHWGLLMVAINNLHNGSKEPAQNKFGSGVLVTHKSGGAEASLPGSMSDLVAQLTHSLVRHSSKAKLDCQNLDILLQESVHHTTIQKIEVAVNHLDYKEALQLLKTIDDKLKQQEADCYD